MILMILQYISLCCVVLYVLFCFFVLCCVCVVEYSTCMPHAFFCYFILFYDFKLYAIFLVIVNCVYFFWFTFFV